MSYEKERKKLWFWVNIQFRELMSPHRHVRRPRKSFIWLSVKESLLGYGFGTPQCQKTPNLVEWLQSVSFIVPLKSAMKFSRPTRSDQKSNLIGSSHGFMVRRYVFVDFDFACCWPFRSRAGRNFGGCCSHCWTEALG